MAGTDEDIQQELDDMTQDGSQSGDDVRALKTELANVLSSAGQVPPSPAQQPEDHGQKFPDSPECRMIRSRSVQRLDCSTPDGHTPQTYQL